MSPKDIQRTFNQIRASTLTNTRPFNRKNQHRIYEPVLVHIPSGVRVSCQLSGEYSKKEWSRKIEEAYIKLLPLLEKAVAKHFRKPGQ